MPHILIPRAHLFGNPSKISAQISPDGRLLAWLAPVDGVLNVWVGPSDAPQDAQPITNDRKGGISINGPMTDEKGNENFHVCAVGPQTCTTRDLTPLEGVSAMINRVSRTVRDRILVGINHRNPKFHDLHSIDLATGDNSLIEENNGVASFVTDHHYNVHLAVKNTPGGAREILHRPDGVWRPWITFAPEDAPISHPSHLDTQAKTLFIRDSRGRDTVALTRIDLGTGETTLIAAHDKADIGALLNDRETRRSPIVL